MAEGISVRLATAADYPAVARVARQTHAYHVALLPAVFRDAPDVFPEDYYTGLIAGPESGVMLAERAGKVAGYATLRLRHAMFEFQVPRVSAYIDNFGVSASARRHGVGRALMAACREWARARGADSLDLDCWETNQAAMRFYEALGMRTARRMLTLDL